MSPTLADKMSMSLDDIIRLTKKKDSSRPGRSSRLTGGPSRSVRGQPNNFNRERSNRTTPYIRIRELPDKWQHDMFEEHASGCRGLTVEAERRDENSRKLLISNLDFGVSDADIRELFEDLGVLRKANVHYDRSGRSKGTAEVHFENIADAIKAMKHYNGMPLDGRPMKIQQVTSENFAPSRQLARVSTQSFDRRRLGQPRYERLAGNIREKWGGCPSLKGQGRGSGHRLQLSAKELDAQLDAYMGQTETSSTPFEGNLSGWLN